jgi:hypothetical protein
LVTSSNSGRPHNSVLMSSLSEGYQTPTSYLSNCCANILPSRQLAPQRACLQSRSLARAASVSAVVAFRNYATILRYKSVHRFQLAQDCVQRRRGDKPSGIVDPTKTMFSREFVVKFTNYWSYEILPNTETDLWFLKWRRDSDSKYAWWSGIATGKPGNHSIVLHWIQTKQPVLYFSILGCLFISFVFVSSVSAFCTRDYWW